MISFYISLSMVISKITNFVHGTGYFIFILVYLWQNDILYINSIIMVFYKITNVVQWANLSTYQFIQGKMMSFYISLSMVFYKITNVVQGANLSTYQFIYGKMMSFYIKISMVFYKITDVVQGAG